MRGNTFDPSTLELRVGTMPYHLTAMEADLLQYLLQNAGKVVSRKAILEDVWDLHEDTDTRAIDNFIVRLRRFLNEDPSAAASRAHRARAWLPVHRRAGRPRTHRSAGGAAHPALLTTDLTREAAAASEIRRSAGSCIRKESVSPFPRLGRSFGDPWA